MIMLIEKQKAQDMEEHDVVMGADSSILASSPPHPSPTALVDESYTGVERARAGNFREISPVSSDGDSAAEYSSCPGRKPFKKRLRHITDVNKTPFSPGGVVVEGGGDRVEDFENRCDKDEKREQDDDKDDDSETAPPPPLVLERQYAAVYAKNEAHKAFLQRESSSSQAFPDIIKKPSHLARPGSEGPPLLLDSPGSPSIRTAGINPSKQTLNTSPRKPFRKVDRVVSPQAKESRATKESSYPVAPQNSSSNSSSSSNNNNNNKSGKKRNSFDEDDDDTRKSSTTSKADSAEKSHESAGHAKAARRCLLEDAVSPPEISTAAESFARRANPPPSSTAKSPPKKVAATRRNALTLAEGTALSSRTSYDRILTKEDSDRSSLASHGENGSARSLHSGNEKPAPATRGAQDSSSTTSTGRGGRGTRLYRGRKSFQQELVARHPGFNNDNYQNYYTEQIPTNHRRSQHQLAARRQKDPPSQRTPIAGVCPRLSHQAPKQANHTREEYPTVEDIYKVLVIPERDTCATWDILNKNFDDIVLPPLQEQHSTNTANLKKPPPGSSPPVPVPKPTPTLKPPQPGCTMETNTSNTAGSQEPYCQQDRLGNMWYNKTGARAPMLHASPALAYGGQNGTLYPSPMSMAHQPHRGGMQHCWRQVFPPGWNHNQLGMIPRPLVEQGGPFVENCHQNGFDQHQNHATPASAYAPIGPNSDCSNFQASDATSLPASFQQGIAPANAYYHACNGYWNANMMGTGTVQYSQNLPPRRPPKTPTKKMNNPVASSPSGSAQQPSFKPAPPLGDICFSPIAASGQYKRAPRRVSDITAHAAT